MMSLQTLREVVCVRSSAQEFYKGILEALKQDGPSVRMVPFTECTCHQTVDHLLIIGSVSKAYPLRKRAQSNGSIKIILLAGALKPDVESGSQLRVVLFNKCADDLESANLQEGDLIGFYEPLVVCNSSFKHSEENNLLEHQLFFGRSQKKKVLSFVTQRSPAVVAGTSKASESSSEPKESNNEGGKVRMKIFSPHQSYYEQPELKKSRENNESVETRECELEGVTTTRSLRSDSSSKAGEIKGIEKDVAVNAGPVKNGCVKEAPENPAAVISTNNKKVDVTILNANSKDKECIQISSTTNYNYAKLNEISSSKEMHCYSVVTQILGSSSNGPKKSVLLLMVTDDSYHPKDFKVSVFYNLGDEPPAIKENQIVRFHRLRLELYNGKIDGRVMNLWDVLVFDPEEVDATANKIKGASWAKNHCTFTAKDASRVFELKKWIKSNILAGPELERIESDGDDMVLAVDEILPTHEVPENAEDVNANIENDDETLAPIVNFTEFEYESACRILCQVLSFRKLDDDCAALLVKSTVANNSCPLKLTTFKTPLEKYETCKDCIKESFVKPNSLHVSILLKNISAKPVSNLLQTQKDIVISNCKIPSGKTKDKIGLLVICDLCEGNIVFVNSRSRLQFKKSVEKWKKGNALKRKPGNQADECVQSPKKALLAPNSPVRKSPVKKINLKQHSQEVSSEPSPTNLDNNCELIHAEKRKDGNKGGSDVCSDPAESRNNIEPDEEELVLSQLSCLTKLVKEGNEKDIRVANIPAITKLNEKGQHLAFASLNSRIQNKQKAEKQTADVNNLDEVLSPLARRSSLNTSNGAIYTNGPSPSCKGLNNSFDTMSSPSSQDFDRHILGARISPSKASRNLNRTLSDMTSDASNSSDETNLDSSFDLSECIQSKLQVSTRRLDRAKVKGNKSPSASNAPQLSPTNESLLHSPLRNHSNILLSSKTPESNRTPSLGNSSLTSPPEKIITCAKNSLLKRGSEDSLCGNEELSPQVTKKLRSFAGKAKQKVDEKSPHSELVNNETNGKSTKDKSAVIENSLDVSNYSDANNCSLSERETDDDDDSDDEDDASDDEDDDAATVILPYKAANSEKTPPRHAVSTPKLKLSTRSGQSATSHDYLILEIGPQNDGGEFLIVSSYCASRCQKYEVLGGLNSYPDETSECMCPACKKNGVSVKSKPTFLLYFKLLHYESLIHEEAFLSSPEAEEFLGGCSVSSYIEDKGVRDRISSSLKKLLVTAPTDDNGVRKSRKLSLRLATFNVNGKKKRRIVGFEVPKIFKS